MYPQQSQDDIRIAHLTEYNPISLIEVLPKPVFPVKISVEFPYTRDSDTVDDSHSTPEYPVDVQIPTIPYIPETTVYFDNPASRPPLDKQVWTVDDFHRQFADQISYISNQRSDEVQPRVTAVTLVEIPYLYLTTDSDTGATVAKPSLYEDEGEMVILEFSRDASISATNIKSELSEGLPGESRSPIRLTKLMEATAKPSRLADGTQQTPGRARYYTTGEAVNSGDLSRTPAVYAPEDELKAETRPLSPFIDQLDQFAPVFVRECEPELIDRIKLTGENREKTTFHATDIIN